MVAVVPEEPAQRSVREQAHEIMLTLESVIQQVCVCVERVEAQQSETAEHDVAVWRRRFANCEESLKRKTTALTEAEEGQTELRKALAAKDIELSKVRAELTAEWQKCTEVDRLREELRRAQADVKSLRRRIGILRSDVDEARQNNKRMSDTFEVIKAELDETKERWKEVQTRLVVEVERNNEENGRLKQDMVSGNVETGNLKSERDAAVRRHQQVCEEIDPLKLELQVAFADLKTARSNSNAQQREINRLTAELGRRHCWLRPI
jgi:chromosome segregation ATPase